MPTGPLSPDITPGGRSPTMGKSLRRGTGPSRMAAETALAATRLPRWSPCSAAQASTANLPFTSVAVVTTGNASRCAASSSASALAPPMWPESRDTTNRAVSSIATTAGSAVLSRTWGAMARTAMPQELTKIITSVHRKTGPTKSARGG